MSACCIVPMKNPDYPILPFPPEDPFYPPIITIDC